MFKNTHFNPAQNETLSQIISLMRGVNLTPADIARAYKNASAAEEKTTPLQSELILKLFSYIGGALLFAGLGVFIQMQWDVFSPFQRVLITLGSGFIAYLIGVIFISNSRYSKIALPAFILAFILQPTGLFVLLDEYFKGDNIALGAMVVFGPLALQQFLTFYKTRLAALAVFALLFFIGFAGALTEYADINPGLSALMLGIFLFFISTAMQEREEQKEFTWIFYAIAVLLFFAGLYYFIGGTVFDSLGLSFSLGLLLFALLRENKTLYVLSCLMTFCYFAGGPGGGWAAWSMTHAEITAIFTGLSLCLAGVYLRKTDTISFYPLWIFFGAGFAFSGFYNVLQETFAEPLFLIAPAIGLYAALRLRVRALLIISLLSIIFFISDYSARYFAETVGWPILLMILGAATLASGIIFVRLSKQIKNA